MSMTPEQREILEDIVQGAGVSVQWGGYEVTKVIFDAAADGVLVVVTQQYSEGFGPAEYEDVDAFDGNGNRVSILSTTRKLEITSVSKEES